MNKSFSQYVEELIKYRLLVNRVEVQAFDQALDSFAPFVPSLSVEDLRLLLRTFTDQTQHNEVMWGLVHLVEAAPTSAYIYALLAELPVLKIEAQEWAELLLGRLANGKHTHELLIGAMREVSDESKRIAIDMLGEVEKRGGRMGTSAANVLQAVKAIS
jgi:hypothetical protein